MRSETSYYNSLGLIILLFAISFFKDDMTPDHLNTPSAHFLATEVSSRISTLFTHPFFWLKAILYSALFSLLPYFILLKPTTQSYAKWVFILLVSIALAEYLVIFLHQPFLDKAIIPKINRFYHSPLFTLFFLAAFTVNKHLNND